MKNVIFQYYLPFENNTTASFSQRKKYYSGKNMPQWAEISKQKFSEYAKHWDADYVFSDKKTVDGISNYFEVARIFQDTMFDQYDKLLFCDLDVVPVDFSENIFDLPVVDVAGWHETDHLDFCQKINWHKQDKELEQKYKRFGTSLVKSNNKQSRMINAGVVLWSKNARQRARQLFDDHNAWYADQKQGIRYSLDQPYINAMFNKHQFDVLELDRKWNRFPTKDDNTGCNFAHYVGHHKDKILKHK